MPMVQITMLQAAEQKRKIAKRITDAKKQGRGAKASSWPSTKCRKEATPRAAS
jgi:hypothetical protein